MARFQPGIGYIGPRRPRGPGRKQYRMTDRGRLARWRNAANARRALSEKRGKPERTPEESKRIQAEVALWTHRRGESLRALARRLRCSHVYCRKAARRYQEGVIGWLGPDEASVLQWRDALAPKPTPEPPRIHSPYCKCERCICPKCGKQRDPRNPAGERVLSNRCLCHPLNCECGGCRASRRLEELLCALPRKREPSITAE